MTRPVQFFADEYLAKCRDMTPSEIATFLEEFRCMARHEFNRKPQKLISIKMPEYLLQAFKGRCQVEGCKYQTKIKELMMQWLNSGG